MKKYIITFLIILSGILIGSYLLYNKPHRSIDNAQAISVTAEELFDLFSTNESVANKKYLNQIIDVQGTVADIQKNQEGKVVILLLTKDPIFGISCTLKDSTEQIEKGKSIHIKGICTGYLSDVVLVDCISKEL